MIQHQDLHTEGDVDDSEPEAVRPTRSVSVDEPESDPKTNQEDVRDEVENLMDEDTTFIVSPDGQLAIEDEDPTEPPLLPEEQAGLDVRVFFHRNNDQLFSVSR